MKNLILFIIAILILSCQSEHQSESNTVDLGDLSNLNKTVYREIKPFDVIMVGEMHGTQEPAKLVYHLAKLIADKEGEVYVGLEIPESQISLKNKELNTENLSKTPFFTGQNSDGRNGQAWFDLMANCGEDKRIEIFYIDNFTASTRDSSMYLAVKNIRELHPEKKILTLSGNIHNRLIPFNEKGTMGSHIIEDDLSFEPSKVMSINHLYKEGTMMNNVGNGLELREVEGIDLSEKSKYKNFLSKMLPEHQEKHNYYFYTEKVNHSEKIVQK